MENLVMDTAKGGESSDVQGMDVDAAEMELNQEGEKLEAFVKVEENHHSNREEEGVETAKLQAIHEEVAEEKPKLKFVKQKTAKKRGRKVRKRATTAKTKKMGGDERMDHDEESEQNGVRHEEAEERFTGNKRCQKSNIEVSTQGKTEAVIEEEENGSPVEIEKGSANAKETTYLETSALDGEKGPVSANLGEDDTAKLHEKKGPSNGRNKRKVSTFMDIPRKSSRLISMPRLSYEEVKEEPKRRSKTVNEKPKAKEVKENPKVEKVSEKVDEPEVISKKSKKFVEELSLMCHQCQRNDKGRIVRCKSCKRKRICIPCLQNWYPLMSEENVAEKCPFCRGICNCSVLAPGRYT